MTRREHGTLVAITQPYVPGYRVALWQGVIDNLAAAGVEARIFFGGDAAQLAIRAARGDGVAADWATQVKTRTLRLPSRFPKLVWRSLPKAWRHRRVLLVTEMQVSNLNAWTAILTRRPFITWGHGSSDTTETNSLANGLENRLNRSARHVLTYTETGRKHVVIAARVDEQRVTSFRNSTDTTKLKNALAAVTPTGQNSFREEHGIPADARIALYLGALNQHKNIDLLVAAARIVLVADPSWWIVVAGQGDEAWKVDSLAKEFGRIVSLGQADASLFATPATMASVLLNPGRVGLVAVDALVMGLPLVTSAVAERAPEFEYLRPGIDVVIADDDAESYAAAWLSTSRTAQTPADIPSIEAAASTISAVILSELERTK